MELYFDHVNWTLDIMRRRKGTFVTTIILGTVQV